VVLERPPGVGRPGVTAWRRLRDCTEAGVCPHLHTDLPTEPRRAGLLDPRTA